MKIFNKEKIYSENPMLFRAVKDNKKCMILGTDHTMGLEIFTKPIKKILLSAQKILIERLKFSIPEMAEDFFTLDPNFYLRKPGKESYFDRLSSEDKDFIRNVILKDVQQNLIKNNLDLSDLKDEVIFGMFMGVFSESDATQSMDIQLREEYKKNGKIVFGLEEPKDVAEETIDYYRYVPLECLINPKQYYLTYCPLFRETNRNNYLSGEELSLQETKSAIANRNVSWFSKIDKILEEDNDHLIAVGLTHLTESNHGLLKWFRTQGYQLEKANNQGVFEPYEGIALSAIQKNHRSVTRSQ